MDTKVFLEKIIRPIEKNLHINIYINNTNIRNEWNNNCPKINKGENCNECIGTSQCDKKGRRICLKIQEKNSETISTLFHELGHITLHNIHNRYETHPAFCETEAEEFAKTMCKKLSIPYNPNFKEAPDINFIDYFWKLYCDDVGINKKEVRYNLIERISNEIISYNLDYKKFL